MELHINTYIVTYVLNYIIYVHIYIYIYIYIRAAFNGTFIDSRSTVISLMCPLTTVEQVKGNDQDSLYLLYVI